MLGLVCDWLESQGGVAGMEKIKHGKAQMLYDTIDDSRLFTCAAQSGSRSDMNVTFRTPTPELDAKFVAESAEWGFSNLKGHRKVGGMRASIYNAMPVEGVEALRIHPLFRPAQLIGPPGSAGWERKRGNYCVLYQLRQAAGRGQPFLPLLRRKSAWSGGIIPSLPPQRIPLRVRAVTPGSKVGQGPVRVKTPTPTSSPVRTVLGAGSSPARTALETGSSPGRTALEAGSSRARMPISSRALAPGKCRRLRPLGDGRRPEQEGASPSG